MANALRNDSSTGLSALRVKDGLVNRNTSVDDFLSLVASGDIPHQDPHMLNTPLHSLMQQQYANQSGAQAAATYLAQQQLLAQAGKLYLLVWQIDDVDVDTFWKLKNGSFVGSSFAFLF